MKASTKTSTVANKNAKTSAAGRVRLAVYNALVKGGDFETICATIEKSVGKGKVNVDSVRWYMSNLSTHFSVKISKKEGNYKVNGSVVTSPVDLRKKLTPVKKSSKKSSK
jgi:hypothetical protein